MTTKTIDFIVTNHGTVYTFRALTAAAIEHFDENMPEDAPIIGNAYAVEHRYAGAIVDDLLEHGFVVDIDGDVFTGLCAIIC